MTTTVKRLRKTMYLTREDGARWGRSTVDWNRQIQRSREFLHGGWRAYIMMSRTPRMNALSVELFSSPSSSLGQDSMGQDRDEQVNGFHAAFGSINGTCKVVQLRTCA